MGCFICVQDIRTAIKQIAQHLEVTVTEDEVDKIANHCSFKEMKASKTANAGWMEDHWPVNVNKNYGGHIRKGNFPVKLFVPVFSSLSY